MKARFRFLALSTLVVLMGSIPALAGDKLIVFKNGKVMRVSKVTADGAWTYADLGKGATVGVRTDAISRIEDAAGNSKDGGEYNRASTENRGVSRDTGGGADRGGDRGRERSASVQERIEARQQELENKRLEAAEARGSNGNLNVNGLRPLQPFNNSNNAAGAAGFRRSRLPGAGGKRLATDQRVVRPQDTINNAQDEGDDDN
jgi:hypothetical protein